MSSKHEMLNLFAALHDDSHQGWIWLKNDTLPARCVVKITNPINKKSIYCEALQIDTNFLEKYNQSPRHNITDPASSLVINAWFRANLGGLTTQSKAPLIIKPRNCWWGKYKACLDHPQTVVRLSTYLGTIGLFLGLVGVWLGVVSFHAA